MNQIERLKAKLPQIHEDIPLPIKVSGERHGACPFCDEGHDRFYVRKDRSWGCRQCGANGRDHLDYHAARAGLSLGEFIKKHPGNGHGGRPTGNNGNGRNTIPKENSGDINGQAQFVESYIYYDADNNPYRKIDRLKIPNGKKSFPQSKRKGGRWVSGTKGQTPIPYNLPAATKAEIIFIPEGEAHCNALDRLGFVGSCNPGGAGNWDERLNKWFRGKHIVILPDNDDQGRKHAQQVAESLSGIAATIRVVDLPGLPEKGDIIDWFDSFEPDDSADAGDFEQMAEKLSMLVESAPEWVPDPLPDEVPARGNLEITEAEWSGSKLTPRCIVRDYIYADVAVLAAPGGTGKTTIKLYELIHIILGRDLYGLETVSPGWCLYVTAEDSREILIARTREVAKGMGLSEKEISIVKRDLIFWDVSGRDFKLIQARDGNILQTDMAGKIIEAFKSDPPAMVVFDPLVSFGASEAKVNDNEQGIISAGRRIRNGLSCAVFFIAHTGQAVAREKTLDQYSSRGGTALPDGSRMTSVMQPWSPADTKHKPPAGCKASPEASITILARPKLSFTKPNLPLIWIRRTGWEFDTFIEATWTAEEKDRALMAQVETFVAAAVSQGTRYTKRALDAEHKTMGIRRQDLRDAVERLLATGRLILKPLPKEQQTNNRKTYIATND